MSLYLQRIPDTNGFEVILALLRESDILKKRLTWYLHVFIFPSSLSGLSMLTYIFKKNALKGEKLQCREVEKWHQEALVLLLHMRMHSS